MTQRPVSAASSQSASATAVRPTARAGVRPSTRATPGRYTAADEQVLLEHDLISAADLACLRDEASRGGPSPIDALIDRGVYTPTQIDRCLSSDAWWKRSTEEHNAFITSPSAIASYKAHYAEHGWFRIPHVFSREEFSAMDLAMCRMAVQHVDANPAKHKLYHSLGGSLLYSQKAVTNINGHPSLMKIAESFLGNDLVQGKYYLKVDDPYRYAGMFGHTHAETHYDCLTQGLYMFLYMDGTTDDCGGFQIIPDSHTWYSRGPNGQTLYRGKPLESESAVTNKASLVHDPEPAKRWAGYESLDMLGNSLLVLTPFLWHAVRPVMHRRRLLFTGFFDAKALTRDFVLRSDYFSAFPYDLRDCDLSLLDERQRKLLAIHLDREGWLASRGI
jgi:hypothetical protein